MSRVHDLVCRVAPTEASVLLTGESGTGKELIARALHRRSRRAGGPLVTVNCAAIPRELLESELFGHVAGAYTGARHARHGLFLEADGGTLFLDEIADLPLELQPKLLRALQEQRVRPVGDDREVPFDARLVCATNRDLRAEVAAGRFREDLYYRIEVVQLELPPLRERGADVVEIADYFRDRQAQRHRKTVHEIAPDAVARLRAYDWPGNVRELENAIDRAVALSRGATLEVEDLPPSVREPRVIPVPERTLLPLAELEARHIRHVLETTGGNKAKAARTLGIDRRTLYRKLEKLDADR